MIAADIMTENVRFIRPEETISDAVELLQSLEVRHLPVVNEDDELVGMLSDRDLRSLFVPFDEDGETAGSLLKQGRMTVSKVMSSKMQTCLPGDGKNTPFMGLAAAIAFDTLPNAAITSA